MKSPTRARSTRRAVLVVGVSLVFAGCGAAGVDGGPSRPSETAGGPRLLAPATFAEAMGDPDTVIINVHVPFEGALDDTDLSIPFDQLREQRSRLPADTSTPIAVYCRSGRMSSEAAATLTELGYLDVVDLAGGMDAWEASGRDLA